MYNYKIGVIGIPGKWSTEVLADEIESLTGQRHVIDLAKVVVQSDGNCCYQGQSLNEFDALIVKKITEQYSSHTVDMAELLKAIESQGVMLFSNANAIAGLINRASCTTALLRANVPMPATTLTANLDEACQVIKQYGQAVLKPLFSTKARGMILVDSACGESTLTAVVSEFQKSNPLMYIQQKLDLKGQDLALIFLNGKYLGAYARVGGSNTWKTTIHAGGKYAPAKPSDQMIQIASKAQEAFNLSFTTVDVADSEAGPVVFEVSAFGGFKGALEGANIPAAKLYAKHVVDTLLLTRPQ